MLDVLNNVYSILTMRVFLEGVSAAVQNLLSF